MTGAYITRDAGESWRMFHLGWVVEAFAFDPERPEASSTRRPARSGAARTRAARWAHGVSRSRAATRWSTAGATTRTSCSPPTIRCTRAASTSTSRPSRSIRRTRATWFIASSSATRARSAGQPSHRAAPTVLALHGPRPDLGARRASCDAERVFALWVEPTASCARSARRARTKAARRGWQRFDPPGGGQMHVRQLRPRRRRRRTLAYVTTDGRRARSPRTAAAPGARRERQRWRAMLAGGGDGGLGPGRGLEAEPRPGRGLRATTGSWPTSACAACARADGDAAFNGIARTTDGGAHAGRSSTRRRIGPRRNLDRSWIEDARARGRPLGLVRRALRPRGRARRSRRLLRDRPLPHLPHARRRPHVGAGQLRAPRRRTGGRAAASTSPARTACTGIRSTRGASSSATPTSASSAARTAAAPGPARRRGVPTRWRNTTYWVAFDPEVKGPHVGRLQRDARPARGRRCGGAPIPRRFQGGVGVSTDGGRTWTPSNAGMPESAITHVLLDPDEPARARGRSTRPPSAAASSSPRTTAARWALKNAGLEQRQPFAWRITRADDGTLYLVVARRSERGRIGDADDGALYRSTDGAEHWTRMTLPAGTNGPNGLAVDPRRPAAAVPGRVGRGHARRGHRRRDLPEHGRGRDLDERAAAVAARLRRHRRPAGSRRSSTPPASTRPRIARPTAARPGRASAGSTSSGATA